MSKIAKPLAVFCASAFFFTTGVLANFALDDCSNAQLNQPCQFQNAQQQVNCLSSRVAKIQECNNRVSNYEAQLKALIQKKVEEKGLAIVDPLKKAKANHLQKMKEFESIMKWHDANLKSSSKEYVRFVKEFLESYKSSEKQVEDKFKAFSSSISEVKDYLDLINLRFDVQTLQRDEASLANRFIAQSTRLMGELRAVEIFIGDKLSEYSEYLNENYFSSKIPRFFNEIEFARGVAEYAQARAAAIDGEVTRIIQRIDGSIVEHEKLKLQRDKQIDFKDSRFIAREKAFLRDVNQLVDDALIKSDPSQFAHYEYLGARYKGLERLLTIDNVCTPENVNNAQNDWLVWGCEKYGQMREFSRNRMETQLPLMMKAAMSNLEAERPQFQIEKRNSVIKNLDAGKIERAIEVYDQVLSDYSLERR
jgi:hypothetical protein